MSSATRRGIVATPSVRRNFGDLKDQFEDHQKILTFKNAISQLLNEKEYVTVVDRWELILLCLFTF